MKTSPLCSTGGIHVSLLLSPLKGYFALTVYSGKSKQAAHSLLLVTLLHNKKAIGKAVIPRLFQTGFTFAQPFLVRQVIQYIEMPDASNNPSVGTGLVLAYLVVYLGIALATSFTQNWAIRLVAQMRAGLVDLIYCRTLEIRSLAVDEGTAITLFNADVERITTGFRSLRACSHFPYNHVC
jgi:ATP-binding cassette subfamily C (CFTR/MRP) protein 1